MASKSKIVKTKDGLLKVKISYKDPLKRNLLVKDQRSHVTIHKRTIEEIEAEYQKYIAIEKGTIALETFSNLIPKWLEERGVRNKPKTLRLYEQYLNFWIADEQLENEYVANIKQENIVNYLENRAYKTRKDDKDPKEFPVSWSTKNHYFSAIASFFKWATERKYIRVNPMLGLKKPPKQSIVHKKLPPMELWDELWGKIFKALEDKEDEKLTLMIYLALELGLRVGELAALEWSTIYVEECAVMIKQSLDEKRILGATKSYKHTKIKISAELMADLISYKESQKEVIENRVDKKYNFVFTSNNDGRAYTPENISQKWNRFLAEYELDYPKEYGHFNFHQIRHYTASFLFRDMDITEGVDRMTERVSKRLGHATADFTRRYYIDYVPIDNDNASTTVFRNIRNKSMKKDSE